MDGADEDAAKVRFEDREFLMMFKEIENLSDEDKFVLKKIVQAFLKKSKIEQIVQAEG